MCPRSLLPTQSPRTGENCHAIRRSTDAVGAPMAQSATLVGRLSAGAVTWKITELLRYKAIAVRHSGPRREPVRGHSKTQHRTPIRLQRACGCAGKDKPRTGFQTPLETAQRTTGNGTLSGRTVAEALDAVVSLYQSYAHATSPAVAPSPRPALHLIVRRWHRQRPLVSNSQ